MVEFFIKFDEKPYMRDPIERIQSIIGGLNVIHNIRASPVKFFLFSHFHFFTLLFSFGLRTRFKVPPPHGIRQYDSPARGGGPAASSQQSKEEGFRRAPAGRVRHR